MLLRLILNRGCSTDPYGGLIHLEQFRHDLSHPHPESARSAGDDRCGSGQLSHPIQNHSRAMNFAEHITAIEAAERQD